MRSEWNPNVLGVDGKRALRGSLERFGLVQNLVVNRRSGKLVGGHHRLDELLALGRADAMVAFVDLDPAEEKALSVGLNNIQGSPHWERLRAVMEEVARGDPSLPALTGFAPEELDELHRHGDMLSTRQQRLESAIALRAEARAALEAAELEREVAGQDSAEPPPAAPVSRRGDLWFLGAHRLLCGDSTVPADVRRALGGAQAALLSTDPPYCVDYDGNARDIGARKSGKDWSRVYKEKEIPELGRFLDAVFEVCLPHVRREAAIYMWHASSKQPEVAGAFERAGLLLHQQIVWVKPTPTFGHSYFAWRHEPCVVGSRMRAGPRALAREKGPDGIRYFAQRHEAAAFGWKKGDRPHHGSTIVSTVWECGWEGRSRVVGNEHPTQKPVRLFEIPIELHARRGEVVLEPFSGSGSQLIAAEKLGRRCRALELEPAFVDAAVRRWEKFCSMPARLNGPAGPTFAETAARRGSGEKRRPGRGMAAPNGVERAGE